MIRPVVVFSVDIGSTLTILCRGTWEKCKESWQQLVPWCQSRLIGTKGSQLRVFKLLWSNLALKMRALNCL